jgi:hypothetical protein
MSADDYILDGQMVGGFKDKDLIKILEEIKFILATNDNRVNELDKMIEDFKEKYV